MSGEIDPDKLDRQRERWIAARRNLKLADVNDPDFAMGGIASRVQDLSVRIVILPADPLAHRFDIDDAFMAKWKAANIDPALDQPARWGNSETCDACGFVVSGVNGHVWDGYCAVDHSGAIDIGLGQLAAWTYQDKRLFSLLAIVGRVWAACAIQESLAKSLAIAGPFELTVGIRQAAGAFLGGFAHGWRQESRWTPMRSAESETNVLLRREVDAFAGDVARETAFSIGRQVENTFGANLQRFRVLKDNVAGDFDAAGYSRA